MKQTITLNTTLIINSGNPGDTVKIPDFMRGKHGNKLLILCPLKDQAKISRRAGTTALRTDAKVSTRHCRILYNDSNEMQSYVEITLLKKGQDRQTRGRPKGSKNKIKEVTRK